MNCSTVLASRSAKRMVKYCKVRFMTHCMAGEIGGVNSTSVGCVMRKTEKITAVKPP